MTDNGTTDPSPSQKTVGRTWADVAASIPLWLLGLAAIGFTCFLVYGTFFTSRSVKAGFLGTFGPESETPAATSFVPPGAVVAFLSSQTLPCPGDDWKLYEPAMGRVIVGAGHGDRSQLTPRKLGETGGKEEHELTVEEMPNGYLEAIYAGGKGKADFWRPNNQETEYNMNIKKEEAKSHNNMPPYIALYFCKKEG